MKLNKLAPLTLVCLGAMAFAAPARANDEHVNTIQALSRSSDVMQRADADMKQVLDALVKLGGKPIEKLSAPEARLQPTAADAVHMVIREKGMDPAKVSEALGIETRDITYPGPAGAMAARIYRPIGESKKKLPVIVYYHGGGWVLADINTYDSSARGLSKMANAVVVSVEYRHAPENRFPAAWDDAFAAYKYVIANAGQWAADPHNVAVAGESAGGNLAANVAIMARDQQIQKPVAMALIYPVAGTSLDTPSYQQNAYAKPLNRAMMGWFFRMTARNQADLQDPRLNLLAADLRGLPPATVITAGIDPLNSDGKMLAQKLKESGDWVNYENYAGVTHEFFGMVPVVSAAAFAQHDVASDLRSAFAKNMKSGWRW